MELKYFDNARTEKAVNKRYRELAKIYHPDKATSDFELNKFTEIMKEVNAEHQEVLVLLKHRAFDTVRTKTTETQNHSQKSDFIGGFASVFRLKNEQKKELGEQAKNIVNTLIDSLVQNNFVKK